MRNWLLDVLSEAPALLALGLFLATVLVWSALVSDMIAQSRITEKVSNFNRLDLHSPQK